MDEKQPMPQLMLLLETKDIKAGNCFRFLGSEWDCYEISRSGKIIGLDGERSKISGDEIWERYETLQKMDNEEFSSERRRFVERCRVMRGQPSDAELLEIARRLALEHETSRGQTLWGDFAGLDEETLGKLAELMTAETTEKTDGDRRSHKKEYAKIYKRLVLAKAAQRVRGQTKH